MAGSYPDVPGRRMALDADGSVALRYDKAPLTGPTAIYNLSPAERAVVNNEATDLYTHSSSRAGEVSLFWIFPELREIDGWFFAKGYIGAIPKFDLRSSVDTTNGIDGAWVTRTSQVEPPNSVASYRSTINGVAFTGIRGLDFFWNGYHSADFVYRWQSTHIYGVISPGQTPDRLLFIDEATGLTFTKDQDWGNVPRGSSQDKTLRLKNNSATLTANTISYSVDALTGTSAGWYTHTAPGGSTFAASQNIASLAPTVTSGLITTRRITPAGAVLGLHAARLYATTATWT